MKFEVVPGAENPELGSKREGREHIENKRYEDAVHASFVLTAGILGLVGTEGCDINKTMAPENMTKIITVSSEVKKKFEEGFITFSKCVPEIVDEGRKTINMEVSTLIVEDAERVDEKRFKKYYAARFTKTNFTDSETTHMLVKFFGDDDRVYKEPCVRRIIAAVDDADRYRFLIENLNFSLNILKALKQMPGAAEEEQAVRVRTREFTDFLDAEFPDQYDKDIVRNIIR